MKHKSLMFINVPYLQESVVSDGVSAMLGDDPRRLSRRRSRGRRGELAPSRGTDMLRFTCLFAPTAPHKSQTLPSSLLYVI